MGQPFEPIAFEGQFRFFDGTGFVVGDHHLAAFEVDSVGLAVEPDRREGAAFDAKCVVEVGFDGRHGPHLISFQFLEFDADQLAQRGFRDGKMQVILTALCQRQAVFFCNRGLQQRRDVLHQPLEIFGLKYAIFQAIETVFEDLVHDGAEGAGGHFVFEFVLLVQAQDVLVVEIPFAGHEGVPGRGADAAVGPFYEFTLCPRCPLQWRDFRTFARKSAVHIDLLERKYILSIGPERAFKLKQVAAGFCRFVLPAVEEVDFLRPVHQPVRVVGVNGLALVAAGQPPHVPQVEWDEAFG